MIHRFATGLVLVVLALALPSFPAIAGQTVIKSLPAQGYSGSRQRDYTVYLPDGYDPGTPMPLVMVLHGCNQDEDVIRHDSNFDAVADAEGFIVVYPFITSYSGLRNTNCWGFWFPAEIHAGAGEVEDLWSIVEAVKTSYPVDDNRIHIAGLSSGGGMTVAALVAHSEKFASGAPTAGLPYAETSSSVGFSCGNQGTFRPIADVTAAMNAEMGAGKRPVPIFIIHSDDDCTVNIKAARNIRDSWGLAFGVNTATPIDTQSGTTLGTPWTHAKYPLVDGRTVIETLFLDGLTHGWYGGRDGQYAFANAPNTAQLIWEFFEAHPLDPNQAPQVSIAGVTTDEPNACVAVSGTVSDSDGSITGVTVELLGLHPQSPQSATLTGNSFSHSRCSLPTDAFYTAKVVATDDGGASTTVTADPVALGTPVNDPPQIQIVGASAQLGCINVNGTVSDDKGVSAVEVKLGNEPWSAADLVQGDWYYEACELANGGYAVSARATDNEGAVTTVSGGTVTVAIPYDSVVTSTLGDHVAAQRVRSYPSGYGSADRSYLSLFNQYGSTTTFPLYGVQNVWYAEVANIPAGGGGGGDNPPAISASGAEVDGACVELSGSASDDNGIASVEARVDSGTWAAASVTGGSWSVTVCGLADGVHSSSARATDTASQVTTVAGPSFQVGSCQDFTASTYAHVNAGRAQVCSAWYACAAGSGTNLGFYNIYNMVTLKMTGPGYYALGACN